MPVFNHKYLILIVLAVVCSGCWLPPRDRRDDPPERVEKVRAQLLIPGERLTYEIRVGAFRLGEARLSINVSEKNPEHLVLRLLAESKHPWLPSLSYSYRSTVRREDFACVFFEMEEMEKTEIKKAVSFRPDQSTRKGTYTFTKKKRSKSGLLTFTEPVYDYISLLYLVRRELPEPGKQLEVPVFNEDEIIKIRVKNLAKRELTLDSLGKFRGYVLRPRRPLRGVFYRQGDILFWLDETYLIPLKIIIKLPFGTGIIELTRAENTQTGEILYQ
jgi:hypothetical protein